MLQLSFGKYSSVERKCRGLEDSKNDELAKWLQPGLHSKYKASQGYRVRYHVRKPTN